MSSFADNVTVTSELGTIDEILQLIQSRLHRVTPCQSLTAMQDAGTYLVDTRPESQRRRAGEIPGAIVIERNQLEWRLDPRSAARIPEAVDLRVRWIVICEGGYSSSLAAESLRRLGLTNSTDMIGGFEAWAAADLPLHRPAVPTSPRRPGSDR